MSEYQTKVIKDFEAKGYTVVKLIKLSKAGYPDILCMKKDEVDHWVELKEGNDTLKPLQMYRIDELNSIGKMSYCLHKEKGIIYPKK